MEGVEDDGIVGKGNGQNLKTGKKRNAQGTTGILTLPTT